MDLQQAFSSQYLAALAMLEQAVVHCPEPLWVDAREQNQFWQIAYHALFYTHLYLQESHASFSAWPGHRPEYHRLGKLTNPAPGKADTPFYTPAEILEYLAFCRNEVVQRLQATDFAAPSGFEWLPFDKLELSIYNLRHLHQHIGELSARLDAAGVETRWVSSA